MLVTAGKLTIESAPGREDSDTSDNNITDVLSTLKEQEKEEDMRNNMKKNEE
jgi:hypothetical protein